MVPIQGRKVCRIHYTYTKHLCIQEIPDKTVWLMLSTVRPGERTNGEGKAVSNRLLLSLSDEEYGIIRPHLQFLAMPHGLILHEAHKTLKYVHFPNEGLISLVVELKNGKSVEAGSLDTRVPRAGSFRSEPEPSS